MQYEVALGTPRHTRQGQGWHRPCRRATGGRVAQSPRSGSFLNGVAWMGCWWRWVWRAVSSARWRLRRARAPLATGRPCLLPVLFETGDLPVWARGKYTAP